jgi:hypothetical protein
MKSATVSAAPFAALVFLVFASQIAAHELKTVKGQRVVKHGHFTKYGHATSANATPASNHNATECDCQPLVAEVYKKRNIPLPSAPPFNGGYTTPAGLRSAKTTLEDFWREKFPPPSGWTPPPGGPNEYWKTKVTQVYDPTATANCGGVTLGGGSPDPKSSGGVVINEGGEMAKFIEDDYVPLGANEAAAQGMVVVYRSENKDTGPIEHVATVASVNPDGTVNTVTSTLGLGGTWTHPVGTIPDIYTHGGGGWKVYKKKP